MIEFKSIVRHILAGDGRFKCELCSKSYVFKGSLKKHMKTCKNIQKMKSQAKYKKRINSLKSARSQSVTLSPGVSTAQFTDTSRSKVKLPVAALKSRTTRPPVENVTLLRGDAVSSEGNKEQFGNTSRELEPGDPEKECGTDEGDRCEVSVCESSVSQNECLEFYKEVPHAHLLPYITPIFVTRPEMLVFDFSDNADSVGENIGGGVNSGTSQDTEDLDLATTVSENGQKVDNCVSKKGTLDGLGIDSQQLGMNCEHRPNGRQCTGDGENQNGSGASDTVTEQPASSGESAGQTGKAMPDGKDTENADTVNDSDMEDPSTEDVLQALVKCRLCTEEFGRLDELALHVCWKHSPIVKLIRLTQVKFYLVKKSNVSEEHTFFGFPI